jgi:hypothetical protein
MLPPQEGIVENGSYRGIVSYEILGAGAKEGRVSIETSPDIVASDIGRSSSMFRKPQKRCSAAIFQDAITQSYNLLFVT